MSKISKRPSAKVSKRTSLSGVRRSSVEVYRLGQQISRMSNFGMPEEYESAEVLERLMGQTMLVKIVGECEYKGKSGWVPNHGIVELNEGELYEVKLKEGHEKVPIDGANLEWAVHKRTLMPAMESAAKAILAAAKTGTEFSRQQMRYAHSFMDVLLPLWTSMQASADLAKQSSMNAKEMN